jgi:hypothetical protein
MPIDDVSVHRMSEIDKYYKRIADKHQVQYSTTEPEVKYKWECTIQEVYYTDSGSHEERGKIIRKNTSQKEYDSYDEAFKAAKIQAEEDKKSLHSTVPTDIREGNIIFEIFIGNEPLPRGKRYDPNEYIPPQRTKYWRYTYEVISQ